MNLDEIKKLYATGEYNCYYISPIDGHISILEGTIHENVHRAYPEVYKLIHKKDSHIAKAVMENPDVEVEYFGVPGFWKTKDSFFRYYNENEHYRLVPKPLEEMQPEFEGEIETFNN